MDGNKFQIDSQRFFDEYIEQFHAVGNLRQPYTILVNTDEPIYPNAQRETMIDSKVSPVRLYLNSSYYVQHQDIEYGYIEGISIAELRDKIMSSELLCVVIGHIDNIEESPLACMFNEIHTTETLSGRQFTNHKQYVDNGTTMYNVYLRRAISDPNIVAIPSKQLADNLQIDGFVKWEPWHTLLLHKPTGQAAQIFWDTREIVGYAVLTDSQKRMCLGFGNANDNCQLLYTRMLHMPQDTAFEPFVIADIINTPGLE